MDSLSGLDARLASVDQWVRDEFLFVSDLLTELGCSSADEGDLGRAFRLGAARVVQVHPKISHLGLGFPQFLRPDTDALNRKPRVQQDAAWLSYAPGVCDRDTVEDLISRAGSAARSTAGVTGARVAVVELVEPTEPVVSAERRDAADLALILTVLRAYEQHEAAVALRPATKALRETLFFTWEAPRLPPGGKYSKHLPHSPLARERRNGGHKGGLVYEHVMPISLVIRRLLAAVPADVEGLRTELDQTSDRVIVTKAEDDALNAAGVRNEVPDPGNPWSRYARIGLERGDFVPMAPPPKT